MTDDPTPAGRFTRVVSTCAATADLATVTARLADVAGLQRWLQAREIDLTVGLAELADQPGGPDPDREHAQATNRSTHAAGTARRRAQASKQAPAIKDQIDHGRLSGEHLDAFTAAVASLPAVLRPQLLAMQDQLAAEAVARQLTVEAFRDRLRAIVRDIEADDGRSRLARQKRDTSLRMWTDQPPDRPTTNGPDPARGQARPGERPGMPQAGMRRVGNATGPGASHPGPPRSRDPLSRRGR